MARIIQGNPVVVDYLLYGEQDPEFQRYLDETNAQVGSFLGNAARSFRDTASKAYQAVYNSGAIRAAKAAVRQIATMWNIDGVYALTTIAQTQNAPDAMIPLIMAEPSIRAMYHKQQIAGYDERYEDFQPGVVGEDVVEYQFVTDGVAMPMAEPTDEFDHECVSYLHLEESEQLELEQQEAVIVTWEFIKAAISDRKEDPTSRFNALLE